MASPKLVILDHDGGHDDLVALAMLLGNPDKVKVIGCIVTDADCIAEHALNTTGKLMALMHAEEQTDTFPIACSSAKAVNPFPWEWRWSAKNMDDLPCLNVPAHVKLWEELKAGQDKSVRGEELLAQLVLDAPTKVTICVTGPLSNIAWCIEQHGDAFCRKVEACIVMGGAVDVRGNVFLDGRTDGSAEWNIFWDPPAARTVLTCASLHTILFSLDSTNHVPVTSEMVQRFGAQNNFLLSQFVGAAWASCTHVALMRPEDGYYAWDVLTAAYAIDDSLAETEAVSLEVETARNASEGRTFRSEVGEAKVLVAKDTRANFFYELVLSSARRANTMKRD